LVRFGLYAASRAVTDALGISHPHHVALRVIRHRGSITDLDALSSMLNRLDALSSMLNRLDALSSMLNRLDARASSGATAALDSASAAPAELSARAHPHSATVL
jgi:hypothetical protein